MKQLTGKVALITGASRGIGRAIATEFGAAGATVVFTHLGSTEEGKYLEDDLQASGVHARSYRSDASDLAAVQTLIQQIVADFGRLDILVNNAGITRDQLVLRMDEADWDDVLRVNLKSAFNTVKAASKLWIKQRSGVIINIASVVGLRGNAGQANYAASKAGLIGFTKSIALELGPRNVRANVIAPGFIDTPMTQQLTAEAAAQWKKVIPLKRAGQAEDVAHCALFLASDAASYITGQVIQVDGGLYT